MTLLAGYAPDHSSVGTIHLATLLARSSGEPLIVCSVIPSPPPPGMMRVDGEYHQQLRAEAEEALAKARAEVPADIDAQYVIHEANSTAGGLLDLVHEHEAKMIILDSSTAGVFGHVALGSVTSRLLHSSDVPVALAPRGFRVKKDEVVRRVTAAYSGTPDQDELVLAAATVAARVGAGLRLAAFAVRSSAQYTTTLGTEGDNQVVMEWAEVVERETNAAFERVRALPETPDSMEAVVGHGRNWDEALEDIDWDRGDVLTVGSSQAGSIARVFLGSRAAKIVRYSPVPVVVVPRSASTRIVDQAEADAK
ncbi:universal stress protein [Rhodococcus sp. OK302]|uniref:universal stress protein n=1 Tax=Rhodococcus sp. OK302 TaxID=1882769 RepID=UPI000B93B5E4|nr:universal stress protein [Rhodococcus sp. OK302]OYD71398.1 nucleotide-binding universal stress UspA family protein [Rhodococcus sp. OK302]